MWHGQSREKGQRAVCIEVLGGGAGRNEHQSVIAAERRLGGAIVARCYSFSAATTHSDMKEIGGLNIHLPLSLSLSLSLFPPTTHPHTHALSVPIALFLG